VKEEHVEDFEDRVLIVVVEEHSRLTETSWSYQGISENDIAHAMTEELAITHEFVDSGDFYTSNTRLRILEAVESLEKRGLVKAHKVAGPWGIKPTYWGRQEIREWKADQGPEALLEEKRRFAESTVERLYPTAFAHLRKAMKVLCEGTDETDWSTVGHDCRLAMQDFAQAVYERFYPAAKQEPLSLEKSVEKIRRVLARQPKTSQTLASMVEALLTYWGTVTDYVQRAEHRSQKEGGQITEEDAKRCILYSYLVLAEITNILHPEEASTISETP